MFTYNFDTNTKLPLLNMPLGGMPAYSQDLLRLQESAQLNGMWSVWRDWNIVLSGMEVDVIDSGVKTCTILPGFMMLDGIIYRFEGYTGTYPLEIVADGNETKEFRRFASGDSEQVGVDYTGAYTTNTSFPGGVSSFPDKYLNQNNPIKAIYFDPFTCQRLSFIQNSHLGFGKDGSKIIESTKIIYTTETGKSIIGSGLNNYYTISSSQAETIYGLKWNNIGWKYSTSDQDRFLKTSESEIGGDSILNLTKDQIPNHVHNQGNLTALTNFNSYDSKHHHQPDTYDPNSGATQLTTKGFRVENANGAEYEPWSGVTEQDSSVSRHNHGISGNTGDGTEGGLSEASVGRNITIDPDYIGGFLLARKVALPYPFYNNTTQVIDESNACWRV